MTPRGGPTRGRAHYYPLIIASRVRAPFDYERLDVRLRMRIRARKHTKGLALTPIHPDDEEAVKWIEGQAMRYGIYRWDRTGWVKEKFQSRNTVG